MKNVRVAKKDPSKILKIIEGPQTHRYSNQEHPSPHFHLHHLAITSTKDKPHQLAKISTHREQILRPPSRSHRLIDFNSLEKARKARIKSMNRSEDMAKSQDRSGSKLVTRQSIQLQPRQENSPYIRRGKLRDSQQLLNFNSASIGERTRRLEGRESRQICKSTSRRKHSLGRQEGRQEELVERRAEEEGMVESAKRLLNGGEYRKSLLMLASVLKSRPEHLEGLYLSAVNWYHLQDRGKTHFFTEQVIRSHPSYSAECYKIKAVCFSKALDYPNSLSCLKQCHQVFPLEPQSYELEGKVYAKMRRWREAVGSYQRAHQLTGNADMLGVLAGCYQELNQLSAALDHYDLALKKSFQLRLVLRKMRVQVRLQQFESTYKTFEGLEQWQQVPVCREKDEVYYLCAYSHYKLKKYSSALIVIDEGLRLCQNQFFATKLNRLLLMIKIMERDIYEAYHLVERLEDQPQLRVLRRFVEGVISLMRRNYSEGIVLLLSIQTDLGFTVHLASRTSSLSQEPPEDTVHDISDEFLRQLKHVYLLFLSYGYLTISEFHSALRLMQLQKEIGVPAYFELGFSYNYEMCLGIMKHCERKFGEAERHFIKAKAIYEKKLEPPFSLALNYLQLMMGAESEVQRLEMIEEAKGEFQECRKILGWSASNTSASAYYFSALLHGHLEEWKEALISIDESINRSEDHYWRYFYIRGMLLACIHSFKEAINDLTVAVNLAGHSKPECYLLRSRCLQIEGEGNDAFKDLQEYISLKPDDPEVHKYAGQLLFENGAFEDSLTAFSHQAVLLTPENYDIFLTESKSFFLIGRFREAVDSLKKAHTLHPTEQDVAFDIRVIAFLQTLTQKDARARAQLEEIFGDFTQTGKIFKTSDFHMLKATCLVAEERYSQAVESFKNAIRERIDELRGAEDEDETGGQEIRKEIDTFANQMKYNLVLCYLNLGEEDLAISTVDQMTIELDQSYYSDFLNFRKFIRGQLDTFKKDQVFPSKNKLSNYLDKITVSRPGRQFQLKLCLPFPKVEPPEITPAFDKSLLVRLSVLNVEQKPEAPWILRETNSIKFTDKMEVFSRLQLEDSQSESESTYQVISVDHSHIEKHSSRSRRLRANSGRLGSRARGGEIEE